MTDPRDRFVAAVVESVRVAGRAPTSRVGAERAWEVAAPFFGEVIDWIEAELMDDTNFRDIPEILSDARKRFAKQVGTDD